MKKRKEKEKCCNNIDCEGEGEASAALSLLSLWQIFPWPQLCVCPSHFNHRNLFSLFIHKRGENEMFQKMYKAAEKLLRLIIG